MSILLKIIDTFINKKYLKGIVMKHKNKSTEFLLECMADSLISLMKEKEFNQITINEITERSGVGRATYFRHIKNKEELIVFKLKVSWERWAKEYKLRMINGFALENMEAFFNFNYVNREIFLLASDAGLSQTILSVFDAIFVYQENEQNQYYANSFFKYGLFGILNAWILNRFKESPETMIKIGKQIITFLVTDAIKN